MRVPIRKPGKYTHLKPDLHITLEKQKELALKLASLKKQQPALAAEVHRLAQLGDLSENAGYQIAKGRLRSVNDRILELEDQVKRAEIIEPNKNSNKVGLGSTVTIETAGKQLTFLILGSAESDPSKNVISHNSPLGSALMDKRVGDEATVTLKDREVTYKVVSID